jgi:hypothetical protein
MISWTGTGELHMTVMFRKPTPYGMIFILLVAELAESKELMAVI